MTGRRIEAWKRPWRGTRKGRAGLIVQATLVQGAEAPSFPCFQTTHGLGTCQQTTGTPRQEMEAYTRRSYEEGVHHHQSRPQAHELFCSRRDENADALGSLAHRTVSFSHAYRQLHHDARTTRRRPRFRTRPGCPPVVHQLERYRTRLHSRKWLQK